MRFGNMGLCLLHLFLGGNKYVSIKNRTKVFNGFLSLDVLLWLTTMSFSS